MTCIVNGFQSKKALREHLARGGDCTIYNPSPFPPGTFEVPDGTLASEIEEGKKVIVTNHPKRSWFAQIERKNGKLRVR